MLDLHLNVGAATWPKVVEAVLAAESSGASTVWVADHLASYSVGGHVAPECFTALGALAQSTTTIGLGSLVANAVLRPAALLANAAATVQRVSGGRFTLGIGAGASPSSPWARELVAAGIAPLPTLAERHELLATVVDDVRQAWRGEGRYDGFAVPEPHPPIVVGVNSVELVRVASRLGASGINVREDHPRAGEILGEAVSAGMEASVWAFADDDLVDPGSERRARLAVLGVGRIVVMLRGAADADRVAALFADA